MMPSNFLHEKQLNVFQQHRSFKVTQLHSSASMGYTNLQVRPLNLRKQLRQEKVPSETKLCLVLNYLFFLEIYNNFYLLILCI